MFSRNSLIGIVIALALSAGYAWLNSKLLKDAKAPAADQPADKSEPDARPRWQRFLKSDPLEEADDGQR